MFIGSLLGVAAARFGLTGVLPFEIPNVGLITILAMLFLSIAIHELGHALAFQLMGFQVMAVVIGKGRQVASFRIGHTRARIHLLPFGVRCIFGLRTPPYSPGRHCVGILGGPLLNNLVALIALP